MINFKKIPLFTFLCCFLSLIPLLARRDYTCESEDEDRDKSLMIALASILVAGAIGVCFPLLGKTVSALGSENFFSLIIKTFAAGFIYVLPDATENLRTNCLNENPRGKFSVR
ncbi:hypothetical protein V6N13_147121 [Hibiscus sabdariffa]|uniref:Uncharacterized protein n=1 Tax=Hibiscus sabdariffa TaxID=183260 RepID=A0ABR2TVE0_9ROSI